MKVRHRSIWDPHVIPSKLLEASSSLRSQQVGRALDVLALSYTALDDSSFSSDVGSDTA